METTIINLKFKKKPKDNYVYIGRGSKWGNPFKIGTDGSREQVIGKYEEWIRTQPDLLNSLHELRNKILGCYCVPLSCHGNILIELIEELDRNGEINKG